MYKNVTRQRVAALVLTGDACESQTEQVLGGEGCLPHSNSYWLISGHNIVGL